MQITSHHRSGLLFPWLFGLLASVLTAIAQTGSGVTIAPIPNQIIYEGGPALVVPLRFSVPAGVSQFHVITSNPDRRMGNLFQVLGSGTNSFLIMTAPPASKTYLTPGNRVIFVSAIANGMTIQTSFILTILPPELERSAPSSLPTLFRPVWADFNGDGFLDLAGAYANGLGGNVEIQLNESEGQSFVAHGVSITGKATGVVPADFDGDGDMDALVLGKTSVPLLLVNQGNFPTNSLSPGFTNRPLTLAITNLVNAVWADFDGDGDLDLVVAGTDSTGQNPLPSRLMRNDGGGRLTMLDPALPASGPVVAADFDGDGSEDLLLTNTGSKADTVLLLRNNGEGGFADTGTRFPTGPVSAAGWSDFNGDGLPDVWLQFKTVQGTAITANELVLLQQREDGSFAETLRLPSDVMRQAGPPVWGDFDNDGTPDFIGPVSIPALRVGSGPAGAIAVPGTNSFLTVWHNDGTGHFLPRGLVATNLPALSVAGDTDGDGALDLLLPETPSAFSMLATNPNRPVNFPPAAPDGLQAFAEGRNLFFFWNESTDPNQTAPLTYNLRVGTKPGGNDVVASMSLNGGTRQLVAPGNCEFSTFRALRLPLPLPADLLYWSVQAVDNSFVGSPFAPEQTMGVNLPGNRPPVITGLSNVVFGPDTILQMRFTVTDDRTRLEDLGLQVQATNPLLFPLGGLMFSKIVAENGKPPVQLLILSPALHATGESEISVTATDRQGLSTTVTFHVRVDLAKTADSRPALHLAAPTGDGSLRFHLEDAPAPGLNLEQSEDLLNWSPVTGWEFDSNNPPALTLPRPGDKDRLYYRLRTGE